MITATMMVTMGIFVFLNIAVIKWKLEHQRAADAALDAAVLVLIGWVFSDSISGLMIGTIASSCMSLYLLVSPPKLDWIDEW